MILVYLYAARKHSGPFPVADMSEEGNSFDRVNSSCLKKYACTISNNALMVEMDAGFINWLASM